MAAFLASAHSGGSSDRQYLEVMAREFKQVPKWVFEGNFTPARLSDILRKHIATAGAHYRGKIFAWDVVNEAFNDNGSFFEIQSGTTSQTSVCRGRHTLSRRSAGREKDPYNDYSAEGMNPRGVPIHGIGLQAHLKLSAAGSLTVIDANIKRIAYIGLQVHFTELDVRIPVDAAGKASAMEIEVQARIYGQLAAICFNHAWIPQTYPCVGAALLLVDA